MPQSPHRLRNDLKCVEFDVKPCSMQSSPCQQFYHYAQHYLRVCQRLDGLCTFLTEALHAVCLQYAYRENGECMNGKIHLFIKDKTYGRHRNNTLVSLTGT